MVNSRSKYISLGKLFPVLIVALMLLCSHDTLLFGTNDNNIFITVRKVVPFMIVAMTFPFILTLRFIDTRKIVGAIFIFALPFVSCFANGEDINNYVYRGVIILSTAFFALLFDMKKFFTIFNKIMKFLTIWSCLAWLISIIMPSFVETLPVISNYESREYYFMLFSNVGYFDGLSRNLGIFREPGVYIIFLIIAVISEMFILENKHRGLNVTLYCVALFTTFSTAGYILLFALAAYYLFVYHESKRESIMILAAILIGFLIAYQFGMLGDVFEKFSDGSNTYGSWLSRFSSITKNIEITLENPLFGIGRYALYDITLAVDGVYVTSSNTNTILIGSAAFGALFGILCLFSCLRFVYNICRKNIFSTVIISLILLAAFSNEDMGQNYVYYIMVFFGLFDISPEVKESEEYPVKTGELYAKNIYNKSW